MNRPLLVLSGSAIVSIWGLSYCLLPDFFSWDGSLMRTPLLSALIVLALVPWSVMFGWALGRARRR